LIYCSNPHYLRYGQGLRDRIHLWFPDWTTVRLDPVSIIVLYFMVLIEPVLYAPDIDADKFPAAQHVRSIHNTPIEGVWHWFLTTLGFNIKDMIQQGHHDGIYNPGNPVHP
jgi:hypothetical protein